MILFLGDQNRRVPVTDPSFPPGMRWFPRNPSDPSSLSPFLLLIDSLVSGIHPRSHVHSTDGMATFLISFPVTRRITWRDVQERTRCSPRRSHVGDPNGSSVILTRIILLASHHRLSLTSDINPSADKLILLETSSPEGDSQEIPPSAVNLCKPHFDHPEDVSFGTTIGTL